MAGCQLRRCVLAHVHGCVGQDPQKQDVKLKDLSVFIGVRDPRMALVKRLVRWNVAEASDIAG